jgi:pimeloyl-ACP methyl ester carboxylesterase
MARKTQPPLSRLTHRTFQESMDLNENMLRKRRNGSESQEELLGCPEHVHETGISSGGGLVAVHKDEPNAGANGNDDKEKKKKRPVSPQFSLFQERCKRSRQFDVGVVCWLATTTLHVAACLFYAFGFYLAQTKLYTHDECDMTYSRRQFIQLKLNDASRSLPLLTRDGKQQEKEEELEMTTTTTNYRLFKFFDQRDPRHVKFLHVPEEQALLDNGNNNNAWCTMYNDVNRTTNAAPVVVVYVPGHAGSFQQSRSIGAHGLGLTSRFHGKDEQKIIQALQQQQNVVAGAAAAGTAVLTGHDDALFNNNISHFMYDVYALDFREQGSALHGALLEEQARFLTRCIHHLVTSCDFSSSSSIYIVAHSIGGIVARLAMTRHADVMQPNVHSIITLGTPHAHPIVAWDSSIHSIYQELSSSTTRTTDSDNVLLLISISGGLRDEMIPPTSCILNDKHNLGTIATTSLTLLGPQHMVAGTVEARGVSPSLGMDHRAIVWCHNLLSTVRSILYILAKTEYQHQQQEQHYMTPRERLDRVKVQLGMSDKGNGGTNDYLVSVQEMRRTIRVSKP